MRLRTENVDDAAELQVLLVLLSMLQRSFVGFCDV